MKKSSKHPEKMEYIYKQGLWNNYVLLIEKMLIMSY